MRGKALLGGVNIHVTNEDYPSNGNVTKHPVENDGQQSLTDHVSVDPRTVSLQGKLVRERFEDVELLVSKIEKWMREGRLLSYEGRRIMSNMVIEKFSADTDSKNANGYSFTMTLVQVELAESSYRGVTDEGRKQTKNKNTGEKYHLVRKGDTYWAAARKYGTTVKQLEAWNPWPAREIPIGVKMRVG